MISITRRTLIAGAVAAAGMIAGAQSAAAQEFTLRMHQFLPPQANVPAHILDPWADRIEAASGGRMSISRTRLCV